MKTKSAKAASTRGETAKVVRLTGTRIPTLGRGLVLVRTAAAGRLVAPARSTDGARLMVGKVGKALKHPGIDKRTVVFKRGEVHGIFAYSADPKDPTKVVRESLDGTRRSGRVVGGKFKAK